MTEQTAKEIQAAAFADERLVKIGSAVDGDALLGVEDYTSSKDAP